MKRSKKNQKSNSFEIEKEEDLLNRIEKMRAIENDERANNLKSAFATVGKMSR